MIAGYDFSLVTASYVVAVLAAYTALYFGTRLSTTRGRERRVWLMTGALIMGSGVWTMHFVGMAAMPMEAPMSFDIIMTLVSWLAAITASGVALNIIGRPTISASLFVVATLAMSGGIVVMHYLGMYALRMSAEPMFNLSLLGLSVAIAVSASGAALAICRKLQEVDKEGSLILPFVAALVMAAAICGMHYTGMMAMQFPEGAMPAADNGLRGEWIGIPLALACVAILCVALTVTVLDVRNRRAREAINEEENRWVAEMAFVDSVTGLPNRSGLEQTLLDRLAQENARAYPFALVYLDIANFRELADRLDHRSLDAALVAISSALRDTLTETVYLARYSASAFMVLLPDHQSADYDLVYKRLRQLNEQIGVGSMAVTWRAGQSVFPGSGTSSRKLIRAAMFSRDLGEIGQFDNMKSSPDVAMPGQLFNT